MDEVAKVVTEKQEAFCEALFAALAERGHSVTPEQNCFEITFSNKEIIEIGIGERWTRRLAPQTKRKVKSTSSPASAAEWISVPTGQLLLTAGLPDIRSSRRSNRRSWSEAKGPLLTQLHLIVPALETMAENAAAAQRERERSSRLMQEAEERFMRRLRHRRKKAKCWTGLRELATDWEEAATLRRFLTAVSKQLAEMDDPPVQAGEWIAWASNRTKALDPMSNGLASIVRLFDGFELELKEKELTDEEREYDEWVLEAESELPRLCTLRARVESKG